MREGRCAEGEAPEREEACTWLWDETSPRKSRLEETVERLRKPEGGTKRDLGCPVCVDNRDGCREEAQNPGR
jgi:DNA-binding SARP family transcriptional activator